MAIGTTARSYAQIAGANERVNFAAFGLNERAQAHLAALKDNSQTARLTRVCDVDKNIMAKFSGHVQRQLGYSAATHQDFRKALERKMSMPSRLPLRTTGIPRWRLQPFRPASMFM